MPRALLVSRDPLLGREDDEEEVDVVSEGDCEKPLDFSATAGLHSTPALNLPHAMLYGELAPMKVVRIECYGAAFLYSTDPDRVDGRTQDPLEMSKRKLRGLQNLAHRCRNGVAPGDFRSP